MIPVLLHNKGLLVDAGLVTRRLGTPHHYAQHIDGAVESSCWFRLSYDGAVAREAWEMSVLDEVTVA